MQIDSDEVYSTQPEFLRRQVRELISEAPRYTERNDILAVVVPGSNLVSQGHVAAAVYRSIGHGGIDTAVIVAPSRTVEFRRLSVCSVAQYHTPQGIGPILVAARAARHRGAVRGEVLKTHPPSSVHPGSVGGIIYR